MRKLLMPSLIALGVLIIGGGTSTMAAPPLPDGCTNSQMVTFGDNENLLAPGDYTSVGVPVMNLTLSEFAQKTATFEVVTPGWRILTADLQYVYDDSEGGPLGQAEDHDYGTGVTSSSVVIAEQNFLTWGPFVFFRLAECGPAPTTVAPTTAAPTTAAPTTAAPTTAAPTSIAAAPATPTTLSTALPSTGLELNTALWAGLLLVAGTGLIMSARRGATRT